MGESNDTINAANTETNLTPSTPNLTDPSVLRSLGDQFKQEGELEAAIRYYEQSIAIKPDDHEVHILLAAAREVVGRSDEAINSYQKAVALKPDYAEAHGKLGRAFQKVGKMDEARASYQKAIETNPLLNDAREKLEAMQALKHIKPRPLNAREQKGKEFAERLKHLLTYSEINQAQLARGLKIRQPTLSAWLTGTIDADVEGGRRYRLPGRHRRGEVARYFNATWLIDGEGIAPTGKGIKPQSGQVNYSGLGSLKEWQDQMNRIVHGSNQTTVSPEGVSATSTVGTVTVMSNDPWDAVHRVQDEGWPVVPEDICVELGIELVWTDVCSETFCGSIKRIDNRYEITINNNHPDNRQRFTVAHEIAHYLEHRQMIGAEGHTDDALFRGGPLTPIEREANRIAAEILMPDKLLNKLVGQLKESGEPFNLQDWARKFGVSEQAMSNRLGIPY